jgi:hypothetical protein
VAIQPIGGVPRSKHFFCESHQPQSAAFAKHCLQSFKVSHLVHLPAPNCHAAPRQVPLFGFDTVPLKHCRVGVHQPQVGLSTQDEQSLFKKQGSCEIAPITSNNARKETHISYSPKTNKTNTSKNPTKFPTLLLFRRKLPFRFFSPGVKFLLTTEQGKIIILEDKIHQMITFLAGCSQVDYRELVGRDNLGEDKAVVVVGGNSVEDILVVGLKDLLEDTLVVGLLVYRLV